MPLYEYVCKSCGERTEVIQRVGAKPIVVCPHCGKRALKKAASAPAIQFKGSGWYVTDYARSKQESKGGGGKSSSEKSEGSSSSDEKAGKSEKAEKSEKSEKSDKSDKPEKSEKKKDKKD
ncbi:MAG TPA: zinc ribbon domain-containing protein [Thermoanaerobaculia bacterium]|jgi:putative FmdB family regulatory protein|nr:zinc ribbon domain-containing protein [Thermoanaerobaculia bacterium]